VIVVTGRNHLPKSLNSNLTRCSAKPAGLGGDENKGNGHPSRLRTPQIVPQPLRILLRNDYICARCPTMPQPPKTKRHIKQRAASCSKTALYFPVEASSNVFGVVRHCKAPRSVTSAQIVPLLRHSATPKAVPIPLVYIYFAAQSGGLSLCRCCIKSCARCWCCGCHRSGTSATPEAFGGFALVLRSHYFVVVSCHFDKCCYM